MAGTNPSATVPVASRFLPLSVVRILQVTRFIHVINFMRACGWVSRALRCLCGYSPSPASSVGMVWRRRRAGVRRCRASASILRVRMVRPFPFEFFLFLSLTVFQRFSHSPFFPSFLCTSLGQYRLLTGSSDRPTDRPNFCVQVATQQPEGEGDKHLYCCQNLHEFRSHAQRGRTHCTSA